MSFQKTPNQDPSLVVNQLEPEGAEALDNTCDRLNQYVVGTGLKQIQDFINKQFGHLLDGDLDITIDGVKLSEIDLKFPTGIKIDTSDNIDPEWEYFDMDPSDRKIELPPSMLEDNYPQITFHQNGDICTDWTPTSVATSQQGLRADYLWENAVRKSFKINGEELKGNELNLTLENIAGSEFPHNYKVILLDLINPIGTVKMFSKNINPNDIYEEFGQKWKRYSEGRFPVGSGIWVPNRREFSNKYVGEFNINFSESEYRVYKLDSNGSNPVHVQTGRGGVGLNLSPSQLPAHIHNIAHNHGGSIASGGNHYHPMVALKDVLKIVAGGLDIIHAPSTKYKSYKTGSSVCSYAGVHSHGLTINSFNGNSGSVGSGAFIDTIPPHCVSFYWERVE